MKPPGGAASLGSRVLRHVLVPLALTWLVGTVVALGIAHFFTQRAFDRSLLDDAYLLASHVRVEGGTIGVGFSPRELETILYDPVETMLFSLRAADGRALAGDPQLRLPAAAAVDAEHHFADIELDGRSLRAVSLHREDPAPFDLVVAETKVGRRAMLRRLLLYSLAPQLALLGLVAWWMRRAIRGDLRPLEQLQQAVDNRHANDLAPLDVPATSAEIVRLEGAINALLQRLERSVRAQREFAGNVAHELRTPLAGIRALADYGLAQKDPAAWRDQLERIASSQARASRLVDQLLELAVASEAEAGLKLEDVRLDELVRLAVLRFLPAADAAGVDLGALGIDAPAPVRGDATLIEGILNNLLDNAMRYGIDGKNGSPAITVAIEHGRGQTILSVQDNGSGLPGELQLQLMQRGAQGEAGQLLGEGAGLGLALVAQYARLMGARMTLGSGPGGTGWVSRVSFPSEVRDGGGGGP
ncbi:sensor histidine kinase [Ramlibacter sp.]|uniref:sensor histidine kinase n=1 Tax=Ramlibacter sp. TaxID=1917967 RepID=UPI002CCB9D43|nr:sensor histidine kinase N-terminal domain-containing protein [Ramlibacter sp.]HWI82652.1 sensor histidine kinase N-terminal domain-containing protein [Ramlibacter sp.]